MKTKSVIGLDWQGVATHFDKAFSCLIDKYDLCVIITLEKNLTIESVANFLNVDQSKIQVEICPAERNFSYEKWKAEICIKYNVELVFDDDPHVVMECQRQNINAILVGRIPMHVMKRYE